MAVDSRQIVVLSSCPVEPALPSRSFPFPSLPVSCCFSFALMWIQTDSAVPFIFLAALRWHLPPPFLPIPPITCFSKQQQLVLSPSSLDSALTFPVQLFIFCLTVEASSCSNIFHLQFMFGAKRISWSRGLMMIYIFLFKETSLCLEIPLKCLSESNEICMRSVFSSFPSLRYLCHGRAGSTGKPRPVTLSGTSRLENWHHVALNLSSSGRKSISPLCGWMWATFKCYMWMRTIGLVPLCRFLSWIYPSKCKHAVRSGSLSHKPNLKSMRSRLGNCTFNFRLRVWGRLNYLEVLLGQHKPCQTAGWTCMASPAVGTPPPPPPPPLAAGAASQLCAQCRALGSYPVNESLHGLFLGLTSLLLLFCFYRQNSKSKWNSAKVPRVRFPGYRLKPSKESMVCMVST